MLVIGLTGSIGMGKSTTAGLFREAGVPVFDADARVHGLYTGRGSALLAAAFPETVVEGQIDRGLMRAAVLDRPEALKRLELILHPLVREEREAFLDAAGKAGEPIAVLDIPLLFETGGDRDVDRVVVVSAEEAVQKARVLARPGMTPERLSFILSKQTPDAEKRRRADAVIDTGQGIPAARAQVQALLERWRNEASGEQNA